MSEAMFASGFRLRRCRSALLVEHKLDADHEPQTANFADQRKIALSRIQSAFKVGTLFERLFTEALFQHKFDICDCGSAGYRIAAEGRHVISGLKRPSDVIARSEGRKGKAVGNALRGDEDVRFNAVVLDGQHLTGAPESGLHFIADEENAVVVEHLLDLAKI